MSDVECEICKKKITGTFTWVDCSFFDYHPKNECGGCEYPVGNSCINKVPKEYRLSKMSVADWEKELEKFKQKQEVQTE